ncbi:MAG: hypothetical protein U1E02_19905 [Hydrogenophaga sp.]|jgi:hypothetical protein|nr:hypothetical protein [Hydrogenophaga sp.]MDZ4126419.1 hypothetical protein [Hydrogenophaga sp.]
MNHLQQLNDLRQEHAKLQAEWLRQLLTLASGGLALLAGLGPSIPSGIGKYFLAGTWLFLGLGIVAGAAATFLQTHQANAKADLYQQSLLKHLQEHGTLGIAEFAAKPAPRALRFSRHAMVTSLLLAVCCLVTYSILRTLGCG